MGGVRIEVLLVCWGDGDGDRTRIRFLGAGDLLGG